MDGQTWTSFASFNARTEENYRKRRAQRLEQRKVSRAKLTAALRLHNRLIALDMTLMGVLGVGLGVLIGFIV